MRGDICYLLGYEGMREIPALGKTSISISIFFTVSGRDRESLESPPIVA